MIFNNGGKYSSFEKDYASKVKPLLIKLNKKEKQLRDLLVQAVNKGDASPVYWNKLRKEIDKIYAELSSIFSSWAKEEIPSRYRISLRQIQHAINKSAVIVNKPMKDIYKMLNSNASAQTMKLLYTDAVSSFDTALLAGKGNVVRFTRLTQQSLLSENIVNQTIADTYIEVGNLRASARALSGKFWAKMYEDIEGNKFIQAGRYKYKPSYYAEMVGRVKFHEAHSYASLNQAKNYRTDLVQVSSHNTRTPICMPYEGKVYSISGNSKMFPPLFDTPPYHPNCLHLLYPTFESGMEAQGTLEAFSDFSKNKIDRPPVPSSFIPLSKREAV